MAALFDTPAPQPEPPKESLAQLSAKIDELEVETAALRAEVRAFRVRMGLPPDMRDSATKPFCPEFPSCDHTSRAACEAGQ